MPKDSFGYRHENHSVGIAHVHLVWIPKRRRPVLQGEVRLRLAQLIEEVAAENKWTIKAKEVASDHVHVVVEYDEKTPICKVVRAFKRRSSRILRQEFPHLLKLPSLWTRSYFYDTSAKVSTAKIMAYVNDPLHERH